MPWGRTAPPTPRRGWGRRRCAEGSLGPHRLISAQQHNPPVAPHATVLRIPHAGALGVTNRCAGICDDDIGACYCDPKLGNPKYGRIPAPEGSPPGTLPVQEGRPLFDPCSRLADDGKGNKLNWHHITVPYDKVGVFVRDLAALMMGRLCAACAASALCCVFARGWETV